MLARLALVIALVASCGGDSDTADAGSLVADAAVPDAAPPDAGACEGPPGGGCELVVSTAEQCPTMEEVCAGVCGASHDCCYCVPPDWQTIFIECPPCTDAGTAGSAPVSGRRSPGR